MSGVELEVGCSSNRRGCLRTDHERRRRQRWKGIGRRVQSEANWTAAAHPEVRPTAALYFIDVIK